MTYEHLYMKKIGVFPVGILRFLAPVLQNKMHHSSKNKTHAFLPATQYI